MLVSPWRVTVVEEVSKTRSERPFLVSDTEEKELYELTPDVADPAAATRTPEPHAMSFEAPAGVAVDIDGTSLVCDGDEITGNQSLFRVTESPPVYQGPLFEQPNRVVVYDYGTIPGSPSVYFVADPGAGAILKVEDEGAGYTAHPLLPPCGEQNYLVEPVALAIDHDGLLVVLNRDMGSEDRRPLVRVNPGTGFQKPLPLETALIEKILDPVDLAIDANGDILLADQGDPDQDPKIKPLIFRLDGVYGTAQPDYYEGYSYELEEFLFHTLEGIALDENRELLVTDSGDAVADPAVLRIDTTSGATFKIDAGSWLRPNGIALKQSATPPAIRTSTGTRSPIVSTTARRCSTRTQENGDACDNCPDDDNPDQLDLARGWSRRCLRQLPGRTSTRRRRTRTATSWAMRATTAGKSTTVTRWTPTPTASATCAMPTTTTTASSGRPTSSSCPRPGVMTTRRRPPLRPRPRLQLGRRRSEPLSSSCLAQVGPAAGSRPAGLRRHDEPLPVAPS